MQNDKAPRSHIPSFRALRCLAVAVREGSISAAARDLNITPGAVSRQISALEDELNAKLVRSHSRGIRATPAGQRLAERLSAAFDDIQRAVTETRQQSESQPLTLNALPSVCIHWLMPALPEFQGRHSDIDLRIFTSARSNRFDDNEIDVAISIGPVDDDRFISLPFLTRTFSPVCSPMTLAVHGRGNAESLQRAPIFYSELQIYSWRLWCRAAGVPDIDLEKNGVRFENTSLAYQAARESTGFVIGQRLLLRNELDIGRMVMPFACIACSEVEYCLVYRRKDADSARVRAFVDWLIGKAREVPEGRLQSAARPVVGEYRGATRW